MGPAANPGIDKSPDIFNFIERYRCRFSIASYKSHDPRPAKHIYALPGIFVKVYEDVARKYWKAHSLAPVAPFVFFQHQRKKTFDSVIVKVSSDHLFVPRRCLN